jgi:hypothetical protein
LLPCLKPKSKDKDNIARLKQKDELKRSRKVTLMYTEAEYKEISGGTREAGVTLSTYIQSKLLLGYVRVSKYAKIDSKSIGELSRLGGLLKKFYTDTGGEHSEKTGAILDDITRIVKTLSGEIDRQQYG